jgi:hypothetical protein
LIYFPPAHAMGRRMSTSTTSSQPRSGSRLPPLFATATHLLGWQGLTLTIPEEWNLAAFQGDHKAGNLRVDDGDGPRLELRWEQPAGAVDIERSIEKFIDRLEKQAARRKESFKRVSNPHVLNLLHPGKEQVVNFGWSGEQAKGVATHGYGMAWLCRDCGRVVVAHLIGRGREKTDKTRRLAADVLGTLECHGQGGWETWSVFDLRVEIPEEFRLGRAKLMTGRLELGWERPIPGPPRGWFARPERLDVLRVAAANVVLEAEALPQWTQRMVARPDRRYSFGQATETSMHGHVAVLQQGVARDLRRRLGYWLLDILLRRRTPPAALRAWQCEESNKIYAVNCELSTKNAHVCSDVLDSLECH